MPVTICIDQDDTRCEVYMSANRKAVVTIGPIDGEGLITQAIEMDSEDLSAFIAACQSVLKQLTERNNR